MRWKRESTCTDVQGRLSWVMHVWHEIRDELRQIAQEILADDGSEWWLAF